MNKYIPKLVAILLEAIRIFFIIVILITLFGFISKYITNLNDYPSLHYLTSLDKMIYKTVKNIIPTIIMNHDYTRIITIIILFIALELLASLSDKWKFFIAKKQMMVELNKIKQSNVSSEDKAKLDLIESKLQEGGLTSGKTRRDLLKEFAKIKMELEKVGRDLAFLAIDVIDSTSMKLGEDPVIVENDFLEYHHFVEEKLKQHGLIKAAWTPDGVMACFNTINDAIQAAQDVLNNLDIFNKNIKTMKRNFSIRCGINAGHVYYDDAIPLEQFSDRAIDIAGHMQKHAPMNTILVARNLILPVKENIKFTEANIMVDGFDVCQWNKKI